jgi:hypothetical protein
LFISICCSLVHECFKCNHFNKFYVMYKISILLLWSLVSHAWIVYRLRVFATDYFVVREDLLIFGTDTNGGIPLMQGYPSWILGPPSPYPGMFIQMERDNERMSDSRCNLSIVRSQLFPVLIVLLNCFICFNSYIILML